MVRVDRSFSVTLQQARTQKGLTQKDLATKICEKPSVIADYESGRAIPNPQVRHELLRRHEHLWQCMRVPCVSTVPFTG